ncbi:cobalt-precorrin-6A reductase [Rhodothalassium salexigens]|uniref:cobalt-precorrin-6A reductase n=1 Tax=Rhodothalassium salexigens TaxID=1086 RepID=UPI001913DEE8|nr:cobalt-precorrin-6A reductase [Rhodothalassium salexigens]MBK5920248.1 cobalt-precorrin-6A reductase [Rhodothalassium salexigens]
MVSSILILGGTTEATALAHTMAERGQPAVLSLAGRVARPKPQPIATRVGGFGGVAGLVDYLHANRISHVVDATHPFAATMSAHAVAACAAVGVPLAALTRPPWTPGPGDRWHRVADMDAAVAALAGPPRRVMAAVGRLHLERFAAQPQHFYLLRLVDPPAGPLPLPRAHVLVSRGPFTPAGDSALMRDHRIDLVVSKNAGGTGARAKIDAARALSLPVVMVDRPALPARTELASVPAVIDWLAHTQADLGV